MYLTDLTTFTRLYDAYITRLRTQQHSLARHCHASYFCWSVNIRSGIFRRPRSYPGSYSNFRCAEGKAYVTSSTSHSRMQQLLAWPKCTVTQYAAVRRLC